MSTPTKRQAQDQTNIKQSNRLAVLAAKIKQWHRVGRACHNGAIWAGLQVGKALIEAKSKVPHGQWLPWLRDNCAMSDRTARDYMRLVRLGIEEESATVADLGLRATLKKYAKRHDFPDLTLNGKPGVLWLKGRREREDMLFWSRDGVAMHVIVTAVDRAWILKEPAPASEPILVATLAKQAGIANVEWHIAITPSCEAPEDIPIWCDAFDEYRRHLDSHAAGAAS